MLLFLYLNFLKSKISFVSTKMSDFSKNEIKPLRIGSTKTITILLTIYYLHKKEISYSYDLVLFNLKTTLNFVQSISNDKKC